MNASPSNTTAARTGVVKALLPTALPASITPIQQPVGRNFDPCIKVSTSARLYETLMEQVTLPTFKAYVEFISTNRSIEKGRRHTCAPMRESHHPKKDRLGPWRLKANALLFSLRRLDIDRLRDAATLKAVSTWLMAQHNCVIYETSNSTPERPRCRVETPLSRPVSQDDMTKLCLDIEGDLVREFGAEAFPGKDGGLSFDRSVYNSYQPCYGPLEGAEVYTQFDLEPIDVAATLERANAVVGNETALATTSALYPETETNKATLAAALAAIPASVAQGTDRDKYRAILFGVMSLGWDSGRDISDEWSQTASIDYDEIEFHKICDSFDSNRTDAITIKTVEFHAREHGWEGQFECDTSVGIGGFRVGVGFLELVKRTPEPQWVQEGTLLKGYISLITAPGGVGKSTLQLCLALSVASGRDLLKLGPVDQGNVIVVNNEDDANVLIHRVHAIMKQHGLMEDDIGGRLHVFSGYGQELAIAHTEANGEVVLTNDGQRLQQQILDDDVQAIFLDPFISLHDAPENDNVAVNKAVRQFKVIAAKTGCAISLIHHTRKMGKDSEVGAGDAEAGRGASSLKDAARVVLTLAKMSKSTGDSLNLVDYGNYIRLDTGKSNFSAPDNDARWFQFTGVPTPADNTIGVPISVNLEPLFEAISGIKWTQQTVTSSLSSLMPSDGSVPWVSLKEQFQNENHLRKSRAAALITMLPTSEAEADPTINGVVVWGTKTGRQGGWIIHKKTDPNRARKSVAGLLSIQTPDPIVH
mgnify:CR=1 FL=1